MKKSMVQLAMLLLAILMLSGMPAEGTSVASSSNERVFVPSYARDTVDDFGYRFSFRLSDGVEVFSIRGSYWLQYYYPTDFRELLIRRHTIYVNLGFYYGKTPLGRSVAKAIMTDMTAFYPKWIDSGGYAHDLYQDTSMFMIDNTIPDGARVYTGMRIDEEAISSYMPYFGGTFVFSGLKFVMDDGNEIDVGTIEIELLKYSSELEPRAELVVAPADVTSTSNSGLLTTVTEGTAPIIYATDSALAAILWIIAGTLVVLGYLHRKGWIELPLDRVLPNGRKQHDSVTTWL